jgi:hypothetical protein
VYNNNNPPPAPTLEPCLDDPTACFDLESCSNWKKQASDSWSSSICLPQSAFFVHPDGTYTTNAANNYDINSVLIFQCHYIKCNIQRISKKLSRNLRRWLPLPPHLLHTNRGQFVIYFSVLQIAQPVQWLPTGCNTGTRYLTAQHFATSQCSDRLWDPPSLLSNEHLNYFLGNKAANSPPFRAEVKNAWIYTSTCLYICMAWCLVKHQGQLTFTFPFNLYCMTLDTYENSPRDNYMKQRKIWAGHTVSLGKTRNACIILTDTDNLGDLTAGEKTI